MFCKTENNVDNNDGTNDIDAVVFLITGGPVEKKNEKQLLLSNISSSHGSPCRYHEPRFSSLSESVLAKLS